MAAANWIALRPPHLAALLALGAVMLQALVLGPVLGTPPPFGKQPLLGGLLATVGWTWVLWAAWTLRRAGTPLRPNRRPRVLVDDGPYRWGRNPMYLGMAVAQAGSALALGSPMLAMAAVIFVVVVSRVHIPFEEQQLYAVFDGWYSDYASSVRRWV